ncbi:hypothetical protein H7F15_09800 [Pontibacter sp. Tf4]|uniref:hypothetical protein n=1 Tax=Pontibacter sp. Tf4 TaxID=2761620 RepID=UPI001623D3A9|nr:hypothetical protein [Pontibacter sp. Tf4]MBB6611330.1 hypothetical protein [Pontibacter sp. Tf4]
MKRLLLTLLSAAVLSCAQKVNKAPVDESKQAYSTRELKERLYRQKAQTDTLFSKNLDEVKVLVKVKDTNKPVEVFNEAWPEEIEETYNILKDASGRIIRISESPYSESGDWDIVYSYYFDENGDTYAYERKISAFNTFCPDGGIIEDVSQETVVKLYGLNHALIDSTYKMVDQNAVDITASKCQQEVNSEDRQVYSLQLYLESRNIKPSK